MDNEINDFINDENLLNVAVSRAKRYLNIVISHQVYQSNSHLSDLVKYMQYHSFEITQSKVKSLFDLLYKANREARLEYLKDKKRISLYDSENIAFYAIKDTLKHYTHLDIVTHIPLYAIVQDTKGLSKEELRFIKASSHIDLLIFNTMNKFPILAIEIDGFAFHKKDSKQGRRDELKNTILQKYGITLLRLNTTQSNEIARVREHLASMGFSHL